jgi:hypothetical protein
MCKAVISSIVVYQWILRATTVICVALKIDSKKEALRLMSTQNINVGEYEKHLIESGQKHTSESWKAFNKNVRLAP